MAFNPLLPPRLAVPRGLDDSESGCAIFFYTSPIDQAAVIGSQGYFPDGVRYGMGVGDMLVVWDQINKIIVAFFVISFTGNSPNFELFLGGPRVPRYVVGSTDEISVADYNGTIVWLNAAGGTEDIIAGPSGKMVDVTFVDQAGLTGEVEFVGVGCTINDQSTNTGLNGAYSDVTLRWDGNSNWMVLSGGGGSGGIPASTVAIVTTGTSYTATTANLSISWESSTSAPKSVTIPAAATANKGQDIVIKDTTGDAGTNNITITPVSGTIDLASNIAIVANKNSLTLRSDGTGNWMVI